jgi:nicotinate-nucleotide--dimethylbenzimidazole phosphoribosyltransferase
MGIGNSTAAAALLCAFTGISPLEATGRGTGLDDAGVARKADVIARALALHRPDPADAIGVLAALGGFEIAAIVGLILGAAERRRVVVLDGFISCSAALVARAIEPAALDMRLGEGTGAAIGISLVEAALRLYTEMATFASAGVSTDVVPPLESRSGAGS